MSVSSACLSIATWSAGDELHPACEAARSVVVGDDASSITLT
jgi:hypothetical protein